MSEDRKFGLSPGQLCACILLVCAGAVALAVLADNLRDNGAPSGSTP